jgi:hypothetical protein
VRTQNREWRHDLVLESEHPASGGRGARIGGRRSTGGQPNYADHIAWGTFIGFGIIAKHAFLPHDDSLAGWIERGLALAAASGAVNRVQLKLV